MMNILWECDCVQEFSSEFERYVQNKINLHIPITKRSSIFGFFGKNKAVQNNRLHGVKYYIYTMRCSKNTELQDTR